MEREVAIVMEAFSDWLKPFFAAHRRARERDVELQKGANIQGDVAVVAHAKGLLQVPLDAPLAAVKAQHQKLLLEAHPDRGGDTNHAAALNRAFDIIQQKEKDRGRR